MGRIREFEFIDDQKEVIVIYDKIFPLYIIRGKKNFLIDTGATVRAPHFYDRIKKVLSESDSKEGADFLMLTHSHWDHVGGAYYLQKKFNFDVYASQHAVKVLKKPKAIGFINRINKDYNKMTIGRSDLIFDLLKNMKSLKEGDRISVSEESYFEVFETPGHTRCSVSYLLHPQKILFPGDAGGVLEKDRSIKPLFLSSYIEAEKSLKKLINLNAEVIAFPHNMPIRGRDAVKRHFYDCLKRSSWLKDQILDLLKKDRDSLKIAEYLLKEEFANPTLMGPIESQMINLVAIIEVVKKEIEFLKK